jgi:tagatose 1,6-diphosphate aldolase
VQINEIKGAFVEKIGAECAQSAVAFFLELVSYADGMDEKGIEFARIKPEVVSAGMTEFSNSKYRVDVLKVGFPVNLSLVHGSPAFAGETLYTRQEAMNHCLRAASCARVPFIYLSEGVSNAGFQFGLELASEASVNFSGVLCGRATWKDGVEVFVKQGGSALQDWLAHEGVRNIENVNKCLGNATPWFKFSNPAAGS